jgi:hypothetical protein
VGVFNRKRSQTGEGQAPSSAPVSTGIPDYGYNQPAPVAPKSVSDLLKHTSYPSGAEGFARFTAHERTTSYRQQSQWSRHTYDTIN